MSKDDGAFRTIAEVAQDLDVPKHVLRFWEVRFPQVRPMKRGGGRRYYRPEDLDLLRGIHRLLHGEGYTIKGVQKILREQGIEQVKAFAQASSAPAAIEKGRRASRAIGAQKGRAGGAPDSGEAAGAGARVGAHANPPTGSPARSGKAGQNASARLGAAKPGAARAASIDKLIAEVEACRRILLEAGAPAVVRASAAVKPASQRRRSL